MQQKVDFTRQLAKTSSVAGLRRSSKSIPKAKIALKKGHSHCLVVYCLSDPLQLFWILAKPFYLRSIFSQAMRCTENCNACSWHCSTEWAQFFSITMSHHMLHNQPFKSWMNWDNKALPQPPYSPDLSPTDCHSFKHLNFCRQMLPQPAEGRKYFPRICQIVKHRFLRYTNKQTYFSLAKKCWV